MEGITDWQDRIHYLSKGERNQQSTELAFSGLAVHVTFYPEKYPPFSLSSVKPHSYGTS